jgi:hypothetical protein
MRHRERLARAVLQTPRAVNPKKQAALTPGNSPHTRKPDAWRGTFHAGIRQTQRFQA